jgi:hypothetical protein
MTHIYKVSMSHGQLDTILFRQMKETGNFVPTRVTCSTAEEGILCSEVRERVHVKNVT